MRAARLARRRRGARGSAVALIAALALSSPPLSGQKADLRGEALKDLADMKATMVKISDEMPEDRYTFKPTPPQRTFREMILHVAEANVAWTNTLGGAPARPVNSKARSKTEVIQAMEASFDDAIAAITAQAPDSMLGMVKMPWSKELESRHHVVYSIITHAWDMYGQMVVALRLNGHVPPASQRP